ncbi:MAG: protein translocase subunit SecD [Candidatus Dadabacteria bacterium]|nr:protein translocase subunit SecD [Candidatus Dadabacteria bacterium]
MKGVSRLWISVIILFSFLSAILLTPTFMGDRLPSWWGKVFSSKGMSLGLDLEGGIFLLLGVETEEGVEQEMLILEEALISKFREGRILVKNSSISDGTLAVGLFPGADMERALQIARDDFEEMAYIDSEGFLIRLSIKPSYVAELEKNSIERVQNIIENRVQDFGLVEPSIQKSGDDRILVQVPGASKKDRQRIVNLIKKTAVLEFKIVKATGLSRENLLASVEAETESQIRGKGFSIHQGDTGSENEKFFLTERLASVTGEYISDARITFDNYGNPAVGFTFRGDGANKFGKLTEDNIGERLAIVLDGVIKSAPTIQDKITYQGTITGTFTTEEAKDLALILRSGSLPVPVRVEQERTVGPSLGQDSIEKGRFSMIVGSILVLVFMVFFYRLQGVIANAALVLNILFIMGFLSAFGVTLTLPGIAGLVLTLGMAVDGNIIIFERIKEELVAGKSAVHSIEMGYARSVWTILDANVTTLLTALILFWLGTGPVKGFAATLSIGIVSTVFSNLIVARVFTNMMYRDKKLTEVSI